MKADKKTIERFKREKAALDREWKEQFERGMSLRRQAERAHFNANETRGRIKTLVAELAAHYTKYRAGDKVRVAHKQMIGFTGRYVIKEYDAFIQSISGKWWERDESVEVTFELVKVKKDGTPSKQKLGIGTVHESDIIEKL